MVDLTQCLFLCYAALQLPVKGVDFRENDDVLQTTRRIKQRRKRDMIFTRTTVTTVTTQRERYFTTSSSAEHRERYFRASAASNDSFSQPPYLRSFMTSSYRSGNSSRVVTYKRPFEVTPCHPTTDGDGVLLKRCIGGYAPPPPPQDRRHDSNTLYNSTSTPPPLRASLDPFLVFDVYWAREMASFSGGFPAHPHLGFVEARYMMKVGPSGSHEGGHPDVKKRDEGQDIKTKQDDRRAQTRRYTQGKHRKHTDDQFQGESGVWALQHEDSCGGNGLVFTGGAQLLFTGRGVAHEERFVDWSAMCNTSNNSSDTIKMDCNTSCQQPQQQSSGGGGAHDNSADTYVEDADESEPEDTWVDEDELLHFDQRSGSVIPSNVLLAGVQVWINVKGTVKQRPPAYRCLGGSPSLAEGEAVMSEGKNCQKENIERGTQQGSIGDRQKSCGNQSSSPTIAAFPSVTAVHTFSSIRTRQTNATRTAHSRAGQDKSGQGRRLADDSPVGASNLTASNQVEDIITVTKKKVVKVLAGVYWFNNNNSDSVISTSLVQERRHTTTHTCETGDEENCGKSQNTDSTNASSRVSHYERSPIARSSFLYGPMTDFIADYCTQSVRSDAKASRTTKSGSGRNKPSRADEMPSLSSHDEIVWLDVQRLDVLWTHREIKSSTETDIADGNDDAQEHDDWSHHPQKTGLDEAVRSHTFTYEHVSDTQHAVVYVYRGAIRILGCGDQRSTSRDRSEKSACKEANDGKQIIHAGSFVILDRGSAVHIVAVAAGENDRTTSTTTNTSTDCGGHDIKEVAVEAFEGTFNVPGECGSSNQKFSADNDCQSTHSMIKSVEARHDKSKRRGAQSSLCAVVTVKETTTTHLAYASFMYLSMPRVQEPVFAHGGFAAQTRSALDKAMADFADGKIVKC